MPVDRKTRVRSEEFRGNGQLFNGSLARWFRRVAQFAARMVLVDLAQAGLTDSSGGTAGPNVKSIVVPPVFNSSVAGGATPASINTAADSYANAYATLAQRENIVRAELQGDSVPLGPGTPGGGTIAALVQTVTTASGNASASQASVALVFRDLQDAQRARVAGINELREAVGLAPMLLDSDTPQGGVNDGLDVASPIADAALVAAGTSATTGVAKAAIDTALDLLGDNIAFLADRLDEVTGVQLRQGAGSPIALEVVAG